MTTPTSMPAVEYRNLWTRLVEMRELDPDNASLLALMREFAAIGQAAGAVAPSPGGDADRGALTAGVDLAPAFDWDEGEIPLSPDEAAVRERVAEVTNVPE